MANGMRGTHQRRQAATRARSLPLQRRCRNEALGRARRHRRQHYQHRPCHGKAGCTVSACSPLSLRHFNTPPGQPRRVIVLRASSATIPKTPILRRKVATAFNSLWLLMTLALFALIIRYGVIAREEAYLERKFGDVYRRYRARVRRW